MKRITLLLAIVAIALAGSAQVRFGLKAGITLTDLKFKSDVFAASNRVNFTGGVMVEWETPLQGLAFDVSALYAHRSADISSATDYKYFRRDYLDLPVYMIFKFPVAGTQGKFTPYIFCGPDFAILVSSRKNDSIKERFSGLSTSINVGVGFEIVRHLQISGAYSMGLNKSVKVSDPSDLSKTVEGTDRAWTFNVAYLF